MANKSQTARDQKTSISPMLSVRNGGEYGRVRAVVAQLSGGNRNFGSRMSLHPIRRKPRRMGTPLSGAQEFNPRVAGCTSEALTSFLNLAHPDCLSNSAL